MYDYDTILAAQCNRIREAYAAQILDANNPAQGCFLTKEEAYPNADHRHSAS